MAHTYIIILTVWAKLGLLQPTWAVAVEVVVYKDPQVLPNRISLCSLLSRRILSILSFLCHAIQKRRRSNSRPLHAYNASLTTSTTSQRIQQSPAKFPAPTYDTHSVYVSSKQHGCKGFHSVQDPQSYLAVAQPRGTTIEASSSTAHCCIAHANIARPVSPAFFGQLSSFLSICLDIILRPAQAEPETLR